MSRNGRETLRRCSGQAMGQPGSWRRRLTQGLKPGFSWVLYAALKRRSSTVLPRSLVAYGILLRASLAQGRLRN
jgi:hypothetical protein